MVRLTMTLLVGSLENIRIFFVFHSQGHAQSLYPIASVSIHAQLQYLSALQACHTSTASCKHLLHSRTTIQSPELPVVRQNCSSQLRCHQANRLSTPTDDLAGPLTLISSDMIEKDKLREISD